MVMPCARSSLSASRRNAYSKGFDGARAERLDLFQLALGQRVRIREQAADDRALAVIDMAADDDVHLLSGRCLLSLLCAGDERRIGHVPAGANAPAATATAADTLRQIAESTSCGSVIARCPTAIGNRDRTDPRDRTRRPAPRQ